MKLGHDLTLEQTQKLILTPELKQAIELLQFTNLELKEYIENEIQENPMLEFENNKIEYEDKVNWKEYLEKQSYRDYSQGEKKDYSNFDYSNMVSYNPSLKETLLLQLNVLDISLEDLAIGHFIIEHIDNNGYLDSSIETIRDDLKISEAKILEVLEMIQKFEPSGVGARSLNESLEIQLRELKVEDENVYKVVRHHLEDIGNNRLIKISRDLGLTMEETKEVCKLIKKLNPKPGQEYGGHDRVRYILPDASIDYVDGQYIVTVNDITAPRLNINEFYKNMITQEKDENATKFLNKKLDSAMWVIRTIEQRRNTIYKVLNAILKFQIDFFDYGEQHLKPLTLKDIADEIEMHESTVSRATNGKYVQTPRGLFEFKYFFSSSLSSLEGDVSSKSIKHKLRDIISEENKKRPYSDQKLADLLNQEGIDISRRTVAKYRDEMEILSSTKRRRF